MLRVVAALATLALAKATPTKLIIDTDIGGGGCNDVDDVIAVSIANALADNGEAELLAVVQNTAPAACAGAISVLNHYYGRDAVAIGAYNISTPGATLEQEHPLPYVTTLVSEFSSPIKNSSQVPDAVDTYRRVLAAQPSRSVAISSIGILTNLAALLRSLPDKHSALDGKALVGEKVFLLADWGGSSPPRADLRNATSAAAGATSITTSSRLPPPRTSPPTGRRPAPSSGAASRSASRCSRAAPASNTAL
jgi:hypothetical protein